MCACVPRQPEALGRQPEHSMPVFIAVNQLTIAARLKLEISHRCKNQAISAICGDTRCITGPLATFNQ